MKNITTLILLFCFTLFSYSQCDHTFVMNDSYGDGWSGSTVDILVDGVVVVAGATAANAGVTSGSTENLLFAATDGSQISISNWTTGTWTAEVSWAILNGDGGELASGIHGEVADVTASCPSCAAPSMLTVDSTSATGAVISWTAEAEITSWEYQLLISGETPAETGTATSDNPLTITGCYANTSYDLYIRTDCGGTYSTWAMVSFTTLCDVITTIPFYEGFNSDSTTENCWTILNANGDGDSWSTSYTFNEFEGDEAAMMYTDYNGGANDDYLISPVYTVIDGVSDRMSFDARNYSTFFPETMDIQIWNTDFNMMLETIAVGVSPGTAFETFSYDLTTYVGQDIRFAFYIATTDEWFMYVDNIVVDSVKSTWTGTTDSDWSTSSNWSPAVVPTTNSDVTIPANSTVTATSAVVVNSVTMASGSSLIANSTFSGNVTYTRNLATTNWYLVSSPVMGQDIDTFVSAEGLASGTNNNNMGLASYDNTSAAWDYYQNGTSGSGDFALGSGRSIKLAAAGDISFTGTMPVENVSIEITSNTNGYNLVGNPYPSYIAANTGADSSNNILTVNTSILSEATLWFWNQATNTYDAINQASSSMDISPAQGFFVETEGTNSLSITEAMQSHQSANTFQRLSSERPEISLVLSDGEITRDTDVYYIDGTTTGFDNGYDSTTFGGAANSFSIYTHLVANSNGQDLAIQSLPNSDLDTMIIPVGITAAAGEQISISANAINLPEGVNIYLEDKNDNSFTILDSTSTFTTTPDEDLNGIGRFYIHTTATALSDNQVSLTNVSMYVVDSNLTITGVHTANASVRVYDLVGKEVVNTSFEGTGLNKIELPVLTTGVYVVQLETQTEAVNKKIIIKK